jgi:hypothetical protein
MTYIPSPSKDFTTFTKAAAPAMVVGAQLGTAKETNIEAKPRRGILRSIFDAIWTARQRQADAEIARYLQATGGKLTDSAEREISRRLGSDNFRLR